MSTAPLRTTGGDHLVETGFVTRGLVSVRMDTRRNARNCPPSFSTDLSTEKKPPDVTKLGTEK